MVDLLLREAQVILNEHQQLLTLETEALAGRVHLKNRSSLERALTAVSHVPSLSHLANQALASEPFRGDGIILTPDQHNRLTTVVPALASNVQSILAYLNAVLPKEPDWYFSINVPGVASDLSQFAKSIQRIFITFDNPIRRLGAPNLWVSTVEPGSSFLEIAAAAPEWLKAVGTIVTLGTALAGLLAARLKLDGQKL